MSSRRHGNNLFHHHLRDEMEQGQSLGMAPERDGPNPPTPLRRFQAQPTDTGRPVRGHSGAGALARPGGLSVIDENRALPGLYQAAPLRPNMGPFPVAPGHGTGARLPTGGPAAAKIVGPVDPLAKARKVLGASPVQLPFFRPVDNRVHHPTPNFPPAEALRAPSPRRPDYPSELVYFVEAVRQRRRESAAKKGYPYLEETPDGTWRVDRRYVHGHVPGPSTSVPLGPRSVAGFVASPPRANINLPAGDVRRGLYQPTTGLPQGAPRSAGERMIQPPPSPQPRQMPPPLPAREKKNAWSSLQRRFGGRTRRGSEPDD
ncbi:hypothetical protein EX30DRAFT_389802 [Ascodesmis nigricans]|uniref:Uncharacterized protein n=1 Tax=Ascodesmis nigricans TaxID=341454 RepID=A0A4S2MYX7_9PEZI|nr:hypothetical protein EX30DRAFT_389802 [Ascodesmis nigricans]